jgi:glutamate dehydrogenase/leucine dehydrogenase
MGRLVDLSPEAFAERLRSRGHRRAWLAGDPDTGQPRASIPELDELAAFLAADRLDYRGHEAVLLEVGPSTGALFGAFLHCSRRGQTQGGVRHLPYPSLETFLRDGLRLALGMGRKSALAGLWWGGGKGLIARQPGERWRDPGYRRLLYGEFGDFVTGLRGCYVTAEDAGTTPLDMEVIQRHTRFATCVPPDVGGSGNPSAMTAAGVLCAMEAALDFRGMGELRGRTIAVQGGGNVGGFLIEGLLERRVSRIIAAESSAERRCALLDRFAGTPLEVRLAEPGDDAILAEPCDILSPSALGGVLGAKSIPRIRAPIVCGGANNQLADDRCDDRLLAERGITYVPDYLANRMGIVACSNEQYGSFPDDPAILRHLGRDWPGSIYNLTRRVLEEARDQGTTPVEAADRLADQLSEECHPVWGHRTRQILDSLLTGGWDRG